MCSFMVTFFLLRHLGTTSELVAPAELGKPRPLEKVYAALSLPSSSSPQNLAVLVHSVYIIQLKDVTVGVKGKSKSLLEYCPLIFFSACLTVLKILVGISPGLLTKAVVISFTA